MSTTCYGLTVQEPSTTKNSSSSRAPKTGAQLRDSGQTHHCKKSSTITRCTTGLSTDSGDELNLRHCHFTTVAA